MKIVLVLMLFIMVVGCQSEPLETSTSSTSLIITTTTTTMSTTTTTAWQEAVIRQARQEGSLDRCNELQSYGRDICIYEVLREQILRSPDSAQCDAFYDALAQRCREEWGMRNG